MGRGRGGGGKQHSNKVEACGGDAIEDGIGRGVFQAFGDHGPSAGGQLTPAHVITSPPRVDDIATSGGKGAAGPGGGDVLLTREDRVERIVARGNGYCGEGQDPE